MHGPLPESPGYLIRDTLRASYRTVVYRAIRESDHAPVILKSATGPAHWARLRNEKAVLTGLQVDGVVRLLGEVRLDGRPGLVFADRGGTSLQLLTAQTRLSLDACLDLACQMARSVAALHGRGIIHHDLNPANMTCHQGRLELIDFGLASTFAEARPDAGDELLLGTLRYMSPEQTGRTNRKVDYRTDFYALGATLYELLVGRPPFEAVDPLELIHCHLAHQPRPPAELDPRIGPGLSDLVMKLLAKTPEERYQSAEGLRDDLELCRGGGTVFVLGTTDFSGRLQMPAGLYGRDEERAVLESAFEGAARGESRIILVHGPPGVGKSALVHELLGPVQRARGYFLSGKCDELHGGRPYFALAQALRQFVRMLLSGSPATLAAARQSIVASVGDFGGLLVEAVPEVESIIGRQAEVPELSPVDASHRRNRIFGGFIRSLASRQHPIALYLDDLQWADVATLGVLESMAAAEESAHVLLVAAYRDEGLDPANPLHGTLARLHASGLVRDLRLEDLGPEPVGHLVGDILSCSPHAAAGLAQAAFARTRGNPFFLRQFLATLQAKNLLRIDATARRWVWDLEQILRADITDNVADLMVGRMQALPERTRMVLQAAACVGSEFDLGMLVTALESSPGELADALRVAVAEGLVMPQGEGRLLLATIVEDAQEDPSKVRFRFLHDRVRHAAAATIPPDRRAGWHLILGRRLGTAMGDPTTDPGLFEVVYHLREAWPLLTDSGERLAAARLHAEAGRRASRSAAYDTAVTCLDDALTCIGQDGWAQDHELSLEIHLAAARAASASGALERAHALIDVALEHANGPLEHARALEVRISEHILRGQHEDALRLGRAAVRLLGERIPDRSSPTALRSHLARATAVLAHLSIDTLAALPLATDPRQRMTLLLLSRIATAAFHARPELLPRLGLRQAELSVLHGVTVDSARGFAAWGLLHAGVREDVELGQQFGRLALRLGERFPASQSLSMMRYVVYHMILPWKEPMRPIVEWTLDQHRRSVQAGELENAYFLALAYCRMSYQAGTDLYKLDGEVTRMIDAVVALRRGPPPRCWGVMRQLLDNLRGRARHPAHLGPPGRDIEAEVAESLGRSDKMTAWVGTYEQTWLHLVFEEPAPALALVPLLERLVGFMIGLPEVPHFHYLACLVRLRRGTPEDRAKVRHSLRKLRLWATHAPHTHVHRVHLVEAEEARLDGHLTVSAAAYDEAAATAHEHGFMADEALALERAGTMYLAQGRLRLARTYLDDALHAWDRWGAVAKVEDLRQRFPQFLTPDRGSDISSIESTGGAGPSRLDAMTIVKVSQALSGEIVLTRLLSTMMAMALENAGAERGFLLLERDGRLMVEADGDVDRAEVVRVHPRPLEDEPDLAGSVVRFVARTGETVVLDDASRDAMFAADPYIRRAAPRAILCLPIASSGHVLGVLYVQNDRATGAFTASRCQILQVVCAQASISLENARLYAQLDEHRRTLEERVTQRTQELSSQNVRLQEAQEQIITQQKLAYLGTLTAGIAHEIRNPLNFVKNFAEMSMDLWHEAQPVMERLSGSSSADFDALGQLLRQLGENAARIHEHSLRADRVVHSMLLHAGPSSMEREPTNLNVLLSQSVNLAYRGASDPDAREVQVTLDLEPELPLCNVAARDVGRAFLNIVGNALSAAAERARRDPGDFIPAVSVSSRSTGGWTTVRVRDNGFGVPLDIRDRIFAPFFTTRPAGQGTGLGLSIAYDIIVAQHRGRLSIDSQPGHYAEFILELPLNDP